MITVEIKLNDSEQRLDRFLSKHLPKAAKNFIMRMVREKKIKVNGKRAYPEDILKVGDQVQIYFSDETYNKFRKEKNTFKKSSFKIIYEDDDIIIVDKPSGLVCHVAKNMKEPNLIDGVIHYLIERGEYNPRNESSFVPALCNRLDRNTSGLVIVGKNSNALKTMNVLIKSRAIQKIYYAIVLGKMEYEGALRNTYIKSENKNMVKLNQTGEKEMISYVKPYKIGHNFSIVEINLLTGRTHQIRAQLSSIGAPILGDNKYGKISVNKNTEISNCNWQRLVAAKLIFPEKLIDYPKLSGKTFTSTYIDKLFDEYHQLED